MFKENRKFFVVHCWKHSCTCFWWNRTCLGCVNRRGARTTRPLWPPTSCTWWDSTPASWGPTGGSSKRSLTSCLSSCMVCGLLSNIWALLNWLKSVPCYICCLYENKCWYHTIFLQQKHMMVYKIWLVTLLSRLHRSVEGILCKFRWEKWCHSLRKFWME